MTIRAFFAAGADNWRDYREPLTRAFADTGLDVDLSDRAEDPGTVDYIIYAPGGTITDFTPYRRCKAVLNLWAGVERLVTNPTLTQPLCRMVNEELTEGMVEYVVGHTLRHHLGTDRHLFGQDGIWRNSVMPPLARERTVGVLGLGELGAACSRALAELKFRVLGWSRTPKEISGVICLSGHDGFDEVLRQAEILILLMPLTAETANVLSAREFALMRQGAVIINPGRGALLDDEALLAALDRGHLGHATLDVFRTEPLPPDHPFWNHPKVTVTPHIAADTRVPSAARVIAENVRRGETGEPFLHLVDRKRGY